MPTNLGRKIRESLVSNWETPQLVKDIGRAGKMAGTALGVAGSTIYDPVSVATEYVTGVKTPRVMGENVKAFKRAWGLDEKKKTKKISAPSVKPAAVSKPAGKLPSKKSSATRPRAPLYTNVPSRIGEPGATAVQDPARTDRFSNVGSFSFAKERPEKETYTPLPLAEAAEKGRAFGYTGEQYNVLQGSAFARRQREGREGARGIELEREKGRQARASLVLEQPEYKTGTYEKDFEKYPYTVDPKGNVKFHKPPSDATEGGLGKDKIYKDVLPAEKVMKMSKAESGPYLDWLQKNHKDQFLALAKTLRMEL